MKICLLGYMGCGKTYIGSLLSKSIKYNHIDLDKLIEITSKMSISDYFKIYGEYNFRILENNLLSFITKNSNIKDCIFSLGGGTPCFFNNLKLIKKNYISIYIKVNHKVLYERLSIDNDNRPLLKNKKGKVLYDFIKNHIKLRNKFYKKANYIIDTKNMDYIEVSDYIKNLLKIKNVKNI
ncbi:MAG: shikimate kinase [Candidatus Shikimatogenerans bostrichidophilus]|nr:MAG: shikimate kinase [Candidatus Shikimatogenerans bostrichidophilus]